MRRHDVLVLGHCEERKRRSNPNSSRGTLDCSHGVQCVKMRLLALGSTAGQLFVPTIGLSGWRAQIRSRPVRRTAAQRLGLEGIEHAIRVLWSGLKRADASSWSTYLSKFEPV